MTISSSLRLKENSFQNLTQDKNKKDCRPSEGKYIQNCNTKSRQLYFEALNKISEVFKQLEMLENETKNNSTSQDKPIGAKPGKVEIVPDYSLPDYLLVSTVMTEDYPVPAISTTIKQEERQGWNIPVRRGEDHQPAG